MKMELLHRISPGNSPKTSPRNSPSNSRRCVAVPSYDVAILGDTGCGKSSIVQRFLAGEFTETYVPTSAEVYMKTLQDGDGNRIAYLQLFDTAGGFEFPAMLRLTITKCRAFMVVFSIGCRKSLEVVKKQLEEIAQIKGKHFPCVLVGNKKDFANHTREVSFDMGVQAAVQHGCSYIEMSAKDNVNVTEAFFTMVKKIEYTATIKRRLFSNQQRGTHENLSKDSHHTPIKKNFLTHISSSFG